MGSQNGISYILAKVCKFYYLSISLIFHNFFITLTWHRSVSNSHIFFIGRFCDNCQEALCMVLEKVSWNNTSTYHVCTIAYFLRSNVFETPMASLSSVGKSHYEVQQSFSFPSPLLYWALAKGQLVSECFFGCHRFSKKTTKNLINFCPRI